MQTEMTREAWALIKAIANSESDDVYNIRYNGKNPAYFNDYSKHPNVCVKSIFNPDKCSSAAGAYQIVYSTFEEITDTYNLPKDFSPANQDKVAWILAQRDYKARTGDDLATDLKKGLLQKIAKNLSATWTSLPTGAERNKKSDQFFQKYVYLRDNPNIKFSEKDNPYLPKNPYQYDEIDVLMNDLYSDAGDGRENLKNANDAYKNIDKPLIENAGIRIGVGIFALTLIVVGFIKLE